MEMSYQGGAEAESLLRPDQRNAVVMPQARGWEAEEKAPFLRNEPVRLTPAWEGSNLPNDTLNLKGIAMDLAPPKDKWNLIYLTLVLHGLGTLTAWNMFITAKDYFAKYKLANTDYAENFLVYVGLAAQLPNLVFSWFNVFYKMSGDLTTRIVWSLSIEVLIFVFTVVLAMLDSSQWPGAFFWVTMISVFLLNGCNAIFQNSVFGVAARLPPQYTGAVVLGSNVCGTLVVLLGWLSDVAGGSMRTSAIYYFINGMFVLLICFDTYFALPLNRFYRYHDTLQQRAMQVNPALAATDPSPARPTPRYLTIFKQAWVQLYNIWVVFFVSLAVFPAIHSGTIVKSPTPRHLTIFKHAWVQLYNIWVVFFVSLAVFPAIHSDILPVSEGFLGDNFVRITCFLTFNLTAMIGNISASIFKYPTRRWLWVFTTIRLIFIPLFFLCNYQPTVPRTMPVLIDNDGVYWLLAALLGWSSGHGSSLGMMYVSGTVAPENAATAGMIGGATLITGIISGIAFSYLAPIIVTSSIWESA